MNRPNYNPLRLLNSVPFGIVLMALTAAYVAVGSARPWFANSGLDDLPVLRDWFDKTDLQFFDAWPLKLLMGLLVANLVVVTWRRIPLTPPRYGVWAIHSGIIALILGTSGYYAMKEEGHVRIYADPSQGPTSATMYYDNVERSLYVRPGKNATPLAFPLAKLPRYKEYSESAGNDGVFRRRGMTGIDASLQVRTREGGGDVTTRENLAQLMGVKGELTFDVVGFYPYALIRPDPVTDATSAATGVEATVAVNGETHDWFVVGSDPQLRIDDSAGVDIQHVESDARMAAVMAESVGKLFHLDVTVAGQTAADKPVAIDVEVGKSYPVGPTGYTVKVEGYNPFWQMFGTGEPAKTLTLLVTSPTQTYRRMVIAGRALQTDFKLGVAGAGPMGGRQKKPLDDALVVDFSVHDPYRLLADPKGDMFADAAAVRHTLLTPTDDKSLVDLTVGNGSPPRVERFADGVGELELNPHGGGGGPMFAAAGPTTGPAVEQQPAEQPVRIHLERRDHLRVVDRVVPVPPSRRNRNLESQGSEQVAVVRLHLGDWSQDVPVPFCDEPAERAGTLKHDPWVRGFVELPGAIAPLQLQLGDTQKPLQTRLTLTKFELVPYAGASADNPNAMMRDFRSTVVVGDADSNQEPFTDVAAMNHPIYYNHGQWLFFQAAFDNGPSHAWTQLGVGNRPFVGVMVAGCVLILVGLMYAFYAKPLIIRRMKANAIARAAAAGKLPVQKAAVVEELVAS